MRISLDPRGILLAHTLPGALLFLLLGQLFTFILPSLDAEALKLWHMFAWWLGGTTLTATAYAIWCWVGRKPIHPLYGALVFLSYVPLLWWSMEEMNVLFPREVPFWMVPEEARLYGIRILSASLLHGLIVMVGASLPENSRGTPLRDLLLAAAIPLCCYLFAHVARAFRSPLQFERHLWPLVMVVLVVAFLFLVFRSLVSLLRRRNATSKGSVLIRVLIAVVLPLLGLAVHNGFFDNWNMALFGDLSHWGFYTIALLNGAVVVWPPSMDPRLRLLQFILRAIGFSYVLYFFVLFLPFLPLSIVAILAIGFGFLMLAPVLLFVVQGAQLVNDLRFLRAYRSMPLLVLLLCAGMAVLPTTITLRYMHHRNVLHAALQEVYHTAPSSAPTDIDAGTLSTVLHHVAGNKDRMGRDRSHTPFLTPWYNYVVLDNLTLSDLKLRQLRRIFLNEKEEEPPRRVGRNTNPANVSLDSVDVRSHFDPAQQAWLSWVDLHMTNHEGRRAEFHTRFALPPGAYISDEYLMIKGEEVKGILAERKAATWIYQQIRDFRRDPSLITYTGPNTISVQVFPLEANETRHAGFQVLHKEPLTLRIDAREVMLGDTSVASAQQAIPSQDGRMVYLPAALKASLPTVVRTPHVHFVVDGSSTSQSMRPAIVRRCEEALNDQGIPASDVTLHIADAGLQSLSWSQEAIVQYEAHFPNGGFFSDRAIRKVLSDACGTRSGTRPVIVVVPGLSSDPSDLGVWLDGLEELAACQPEPPHLFVLENDGSLSERSYAEPFKVIRANARINVAIPVHAWPDAASPRAYLTVDGLPSTALLEAEGSMPNDTLSYHSWSAALALEGRWRSLMLHPESGTPGWLDVVRASFRTQVLSPLTAWICLENATQRNALMKKQEDVLNADAALDAGEEEMVRMSEPGMIWLLLASVLFFVMRTRRPAP